MEPYPTPFSGAARAANYVEQDTPPLSAPDSDPDDVELDVDAEPVAPDVDADAEGVQWSTDEEIVPPPAAPPGAALGRELSQDLAGAWFASGITNGQEHARAARAQTGVRGVAAKFGLPVAPSRREVREARDAQLLAEAETCVRQSTWPRAIGVLVANRKGGTGKTPVALCLAGTLATIRGGGVAVLEVSDDPGMLSLRAEGAPRVGLGELMRDAAQISSAGQLAAYTALQTSHAAVIGSVRPRPNLDGNTIVAIAKLIDTHYSIRVMDSGNVYTSSAFGAAVHTADVLVIPIADAADSVQDALALVGHLSGYPEGQRLLSSAVIIRLRYIGATREIEARTDEAIAAMGVRRVVDVPEDPHIAERGEISLSKLHPRTRNAFLLAAASVVSEVRI